MPTASPSPAGRCPVYIGHAGWSFADWNGPVYPKPRPKGFHPLPYLAQYLNLVEVNSSFYRPPTAREVEAWMEQLARGNIAPEAMRFTFKVASLFTHTDPGPPRDSLSDAEIRAFLDGVKPVRDAGRDVALLLQFPFFFRNEPRNREHLWRLADGFGPSASNGWPLAVELRDRGWMADADILATMRNRGLALVGVDMPVARNTPSRELFQTAPLRYLRLHGRNADAWFDKKAPVWAKYDYLYSPAELEPWIEAIREAREEAEAVVVVANNHYRGQGLTNALQIKAALEGAPVDVPESLREAYPDAFPGAVARPPRRRTLFD